MRVLFPLVVCLLLGLGAAAAEEKQPTVVEAADAVEQAVAKKNAAEVAKLARREAPDPWLVGEELLRRGADVAATQFAKANDNESLSSYVAARQEKPAAQAEHDALATLRRAFAARDGKGALAAAGEVRGDLDSVVRVEVAFEAGIVLQRMRRHAESAAALRTVALAAEKLGWLRRAAEAFAEAGISAYQAKTPQGAVTSWRAGMAVLERLGDERGVASSHYRIGRAYAAQRMRRLAIASYDKALAIYRRLDVVERIASIEHHVAAEENARGNYPAAKSRYEAALAGFRRMGSKPHIGPTLHNLGIVLDNMSDYRGALERYSEALDVFRELGNQGAVAHALDSVGRMHHKLGGYPKALAHAQEALALARDLKNAPRIAVSLSSVGNLLEEMGNYTDALKLFEESRSLYERLGDKGGLASALHDIAGVNEVFGQHDEATQHYKRALELVREVKDPHGEAVALNSLGLFHSRSGRIGEALRYYEQSLELQRKLGNRGGIATALQNIGNAKGFVGDEKTGLEFLERALRIHQDTGEKDAEARVLHDIGSWQEALDRFDEAFASYRAALAIKRELDAKDGVAATLLNLGIVRSRQGKHEEAIRTYQEALATFESIGNMGRTASAHNSIGVAREQLGDLDGAIAAFEKARQIVADFPNRDTSARAAWGLARAWLRKGDADRATELAREGVQAVLRLATGLAEGEGAGARDVYAELFEIGTRSALRAGRTEELHWFIEQGRAGSLRESLGSRSALESAVIPADLRQALAEARQQEQHALLVYTRAAASRRLGGMRKARKAWLEARTATEQTTQRIEREAKAAAAVTLAAPDGLDQVRGHLETGDVLVQYALTDAEGVALVISADGVRAVALADTGQIEAAAEALLDSSRGVDPSQADALRKLVVEPLQLGKNAKRILVSPTGILGYVPFALLLPQHEVSYVPSGTTLGLLVPERVHRGDGVLALGDPDYRTGRAGQRSRTRGADRSRPLASLPASRKEVEAIGTTTLLAQAATETNLRPAIEQKARWRAVHFACHGLVDAERPMLSALALTADDENDGFVTALELFGAKVPADLVVMSACETGKGRIYKTEGIVGLTRAFMFAGSPRVLCSLWKVDDEATRALMIKFYELWNPKPSALSALNGDGKKGLGAAEALKAAQAYIRSQPSWKHPYYWAAWVLWGLPR